MGINPIFTNLYSHQLLYILNPNSYTVPEPVVIVAIWRINMEVVHGQSAVSGEAAPMLHVFSSYR
jgi:hypothetical protein